MSKILLLGNGFDLNHWLPTRYIDFLNTVMHLEKHYNKNVVTIGQVWGIPKFIESDKFFNTCYLKYGEAYNSTKLDSDNIKRLLDLAKTNIWYNYLCEVLNIDLGWIDFEREIAQVLQSFDTFFIENKDSVFGLQLKISAEKIYEHIISKFDYFYKRANPNLPDNKTMQIRDEFLHAVPFNTNNIVINKVKIIDVLYNELLVLADMLQLYLQCFINAPMQKLIDDGLINRNSWFDNADYVFTFNYSYTYEMLYAPSKEINHIHGDINTKIILGVNPDSSDELGSIDTTFLRFKKYYQRILLGTDRQYLNILRAFDPLTGYEYLDEETKRKLLASEPEHELIVVGHSLDVTDKDIITDLFGISSNITVMYHNDAAFADHVKNLVDIFGKTKFDELRLKKLRFKKL